MTDEEFNTKLRELISEISTLPQGVQGKLNQVVEETKQRHGEIKTASAKIQKSLTALRVCIKYMIFDLEATRRERDALKAMLDANEDQD